MTWFFTFIATRNIGSYKTKPKVNFYSRFSKNTFIGKNCHFNGLIIRGNGKVLIGDNFHSGKNILIITSNHKYDNANAIPYDTKEIINKDVIIEDNVWVGDRVIILGGVRIHEGVIIQAGAVVVNDIDAYSIVGGNPAKVFKHRNKDDYEKLKKEGKFC
jgi:acetyltransferase-like isoleucine patch superfamily enzyme